jgi:hypothetical protein
MTIEEQTGILMVATHESGHAFCCGHFGMLAEIHIFSSRRGACFHDAGSSYTSGVIALAGLMAETLTGLTQHRRGIPLTANTISEWTNPFSVHHASVSRSDLRSIRLALQDGYNLVDLAARCFQILSSNLPGLNDLALSMAVEALAEFEAMGLPTDEQAATEYRRVRCDHGLDDIDIDAQPLTWRIHH